MNNKYGRRKKFNRYDLSTNDYGIGFTSKGEQFLFDKEDFEKIKDICWHKDTVTGYIRGHIPLTQKRVHLHRLVTDASWDEIVDHINHNKQDSRKVNLRKCSKSQNHYNAIKRKDNVSGVTGVWFDKSRNRWACQISVDHKKIPLGRFKNLNDAILARKNAENKYFGAFSYENSINHTDS